ncbi:sigma-70 family RNA polymerase sigma factor [Kibdelosporangium aridum]|nr:sigma-70 family RNA polymerase sigma factor [Kibdelosporangium aridum]
MHRDDFDDFYRAEIGPLVALLRQAGSNESRACDAAQQAMIRAYAAWPELREPDLWVRRTARRVADQNLWDARAVEFDVEAMLAALKEHPSARPLAGPSGLRDIDLWLAAAGDRAAMRRILIAVQALVTPYCQARIGSQWSVTSPQDVAQDVCFAVMAAVGSYRAQARPFLAFVYRVAAFKVREARRGAASDRSTPVEEVETTHDELSNSMAQLLTVLPDAQREILILRLVVGLTPDEIGDALGMTQGAVRVAQHRALTRLRTIMAANRS